MPSLENHVHVYVHVHIHVHVQIRVGEPCITHNYYHKTSSHKYELIKMCFISYYYNSYLGSGASNLSSSGNDALVNDIPECG